MKFAASFLETLGSGGLRRDRRSASTSESSITPGFTGDGRLVDEQGISRSIKSAPSGVDLCSIGGTLQLRCGEPLYSPESSFEPVSSSVKSPPGLVVFNGLGRRMLLIASKSMSMSNSVKDIRSPTGGGSGIAGCRSGSGRDSGTGAISQSSVAACCGNGLNDPSPSRTIKSAKKESKTELR